jgi:hypothetical protein
LAVSASGSGFQGGAMDRGLGWQAGSCPGGSVSVCVWPHRRAKPRLLMAAMGAALRCPLSFSIWAQPLAGTNFRGGFGRLRFEGLVSSFSGGCAAAHVVDNTHQERKTAPKGGESRGPLGAVMGRYATSTPWTVVSVPARSTNLHRKRRLPEPGATRPRGSALPPLGRRSLTYGRPGRRSDTRFAMVGVPASAIGQSTTAQRLSIGWTFEKIENGA